MLVLALLWPLGPACAPGPQPRVNGVYAHDSRLLVRLDYDNDGDGRVDSRTYIRGGRPRRLEADTDRDGRVDRWEYYTDTGALARVGASTQHDGREDIWVRVDGDLRLVEISTQRDGRIDRRETYERNVLTRAESDTNGDGLADRWEEFHDGALVRLQLDEARRHGRPTLQLLYAAGREPRAERVPSADAGGNHDAAR